MRGIIDLNLTLAGDEGIEFVSTFGSAAGQKQLFKPDSTKGFVKFELANAFPNALIYGTALHPNVIAKSYGTMLYQPFNMEHQIAAYHKKKGMANHTEDRILGSIHGVSFPTASMGSWRVGADASAAPKITAIASYSKLAKGMEEVLGAHSSGKHRYSVSMEVQYPFNEVGFAVHRDGKSPLKELANTTPDDMANAGFDYVPIDQAPSQIASFDEASGQFSSGVFNKNKGRIDSNYKGRKVTMLMGGLDGMVHFAGVGLVKYAAESKAGINRMMASADSLLIEPFAGLTEFLVSLVPKK